MANCMNCPEAKEATNLFQGVPICADCFKIVSHYIERTKNEMHMLFLTYTDMLRVALIKGELRPPRMPNTDVMPLSELSKAIKEMTHAKDRSKGPDGTT